MPSPFPGMDPFIESQKWEDFHLSAITVMRELLADAVGDRYIVNVHERVYLQASESDDLLIVADLSVNQPTERTEPQFAPAASASTMVAPVECLLPKGEPISEGYLEIRTTDGDRLVTVIELLSPANKRAGSVGARKYLAKRRRLLESSVNLVEIDLLRGGRRLPMGSPLPAGHYMAIVSRGRLRPKSSVYSWRLSDRMPAIPIPLAARDAEPMLDLQTVLDLVYDRAHYHRSLKYATPPVPPLSPEMADWTQSILNTRSSPSTP